jgi:class I fructose-bisphosphate aldolase
MERMQKIFKNDGKSVIVAMDHGMGLNVLPDLNDTGGILEKIIAGGADAILTTFGIARRYKDILANTNLILRLDGGTTQLSTKNTYPRLMYSVEDALELGAVGVACMGFPGIEDEAENLTNLAYVAAACNHYQIPLVAEMLPGGFGNEIPNTVENVKLASRIGCELGAHIIKTTFAGEVEEFEDVVKGSFSPVVVLGGDKVKNIGDLFSLIEDALRAGAKGVAIGRNVWKHKNPDKVTAALVGLVHEGKKAEECLELVK